MNETSPIDVPEAKTPQRSSAGPVEAVLRALDTLRYLNHVSGATVSQVARATSQARSTAYRTLKTLCYAGYAVCDPVDGLYRPSVQTQLLARGFHDEPWIRDIARPVMQKLAEEVVWPITVATLSGLKIVVRDTTDRDSPLAVQRYAPGFRGGMLSTSAGIAFIAFTDEPQRGAFLDILAQSHDPVDQPARTLDTLRPLLEEVRRQGFAVFNRDSYNEATVSVPILVGETLPLGTLTVRCIKSAMTGQTAGEKYGAKLIAAARTIAQRYGAAKTNGEG
jgi:IclR family mhp operon transcriptional activator